MRATKYAPLGAFLAALPPETATVTLTLSEIETILGEPLPGAAATRMWWSNSRHRRAEMVWVAVGWRVQRAEMRRVMPTITFARAASGDTETGTARAPQPPVRAHEQLAPPAPAAGTAEQ
jgi:hypothetical protein